MQPTRSSRFVPAVQGGIIAIHPTRSLWPVATLVLTFLACTGGEVTHPGPESGAGADSGVASTVDARPDAGALAAPALNDAQFAGQTAPVRAIAGSFFQVSVTMRNTGTATWSRDAGYYLGSTGPMDNLTWGTNRGFMDPATSVPPGATTTFVVAVTAPTQPDTYPMRWQMLQDAVEWFGEPSAALSVNVEARPFPSTDELRRFAGDFGGIYIPDIAPQCPEDPVTHIRCDADNGGTPRGLLAGALFTPAYGLYTDAQRAKIRAAYKARRYTHFPVSLFCGGGNWYHGLYPPMPCGHFNEQLTELWNDGLVPVCFVLPDGELSADLTGLDRSLCKVVVPMWEMNGPLADDTARINQAILFTRQSFPDALLYVHFTAQHAAGGSPEADWWIWAAQDPAGPRVQGILYQDDRWNDPAAVKDRVTDFLVRLGGGYHGWPNPVDVVLFETDIYPKFWDGRTEAEGLAFNDQVLTLMQSPACVSETGVSYCGKLAGFGSGGTVP